MKKIKEILVFILFVTGSLMIVGVQMSSLESIGCAVLGFGLVAAAGKLYG